MKRSEFLEKWSPIIPGVQITWDWTPGQGSPMIGVFRVILGDKVLFTSEHHGGPFNEPSALIGADDYLTAREHLLSL